MMTWRRRTDHGGRNHRGKLLRDTTDSLLGCLSMRAYQQQRLPHTSQTKNRLLAFRLLGEPSLDPGCIPKRTCFSVPSHQWRVARSHCLCLKQP